MLCSECNNQIHPYMTFCPHCGVRIKSDVESPQHPEAETNNQKLCSQCEFVSEASLRFCGSCGKEFEDSNETSPEPPSLEDLKEEENMKSCPTCGEPVRPELSFCISCGTNLITSESYSDPTQDMPSSLVSAPKMPKTESPHSEKEKSRASNFSWTDTLKTLYSENAMSSILGLGILLVTIGSLVILVSMWEEESNRPYLVLLSAIQVAAFIFVGHMVKNRMNLHLSGLAFITIAAVWALFTSGVITYLVFDPISPNPKLPGIDLEIHLEPKAWLMLVALALPLWGCLSYVYKGYVLTHGSLLLAGVAVSLIVFVFDNDWQSWEWSYFFAGISVVYISTGIVWRIRGNDIVNEVIFSIGNVLAALTILITIGETNTWGKVVILVLAGFYFLTSGATVIELVSSKVPLLRGPKHLVSVFFPMALGASALSLTIAFISAAILLSFDWQISLLALTSLLTVISVIAMIFAKRWYWLYPVTIFAHISALLAITLPQIGIGDPHTYGLITIPIVSIYIFFLTFAYKKVNPRTEGYSNFVDRRLAPLVAIACVDVLVSIIVSGWSDWSNTEGILAASVYTIITVIVCYISKNRYVPYATTVLVAITSMFLVGNIGDGSWTLRAVCWSIQGLASWWMAAGIGKLSESSNRPWLEIWETPLRQTSTRFAIASTIFVILAVILSLSGENDSGSHIINATTVVAILGLLYLGIGITKRDTRYVYVSAASLILSWYIQAANQEFSGVHFYAIPAGLYLLGLAYFEYRRKSRLKFLAPVSNALAILILPLSAFLQSIYEKPELFYFFLSGFESLLLIFWGLYSKSRIILIGSLATFTINLLWNLGRLLPDIDGAVLAITIGILLIAVAVILERMKERVTQSGRVWIEQLSDWNW
ncbi:MAG: zinc ribbon domain-containing protein [Chloroflexota bacterium]|nr:zinc ribbon domain-containing protein [Chloroflexota bacterium]